MSSSRLCTQYELRELKGTGCGLDYLGAFSTSYCTTKDGEKGVYVLSGLDTDTPQTNCVAMTTAFSGVRCCADEDVPAVPRSERSCEELGWFTSDTGNVRVCGGSLVSANNTCIEQPVSYSEALSICNSKGARLCSYSEAVTGHAGGTGCYKDGQFIWTGTDCGRCDRGAHMTVNYVQGATATDACSRDGQLAHVRCCADFVDEGSVLTGSSCKTCGELGWIPLETTADTCADSFVIGAAGRKGACVDEEISFAAAEQLCFDIGARLCSFEEIAAGAADGSGCGHDLNMIWTRSPCGTDGFRVREGVAFRTGEACRSRTVGRAYVRCCGDEDTITSDLSCDVLRNRAESQGNADASDISQNGWSLPTDADDDVCSASFMAYDQQGRPLPPQPDGQIIGGPRCIVNATAAVADRVCAANGARVCTRAEMARETGGTGCGFDGQHVISSAPCTTPVADDNTGGVDGVIVFRRTDGNEKCVPRTEALYAVRCCAEENPPPKERSAISCEEFGWQETEFGLVDTCGESEVLENKAGDFVCAPLSVFNDAAAVCKKIGARLCTYAELVAGEARGTGCGHDGDFVWSATECGRCGRRSYLAYSHASVAQLGHGTAACVPADQFRRVRCCADSIASLIIPTTLRPKTSPEPTPSATPTPVVTTDDATVTTSPAQTTPAVASTTTTPSTLSSSTEASGSSSSAPDSTPTPPPTTPPTSTSAQTTTPTVDVQPGTQKTTATAKFAGLTLSMLPATFDAIFMRAVLTVVNADAVLLFSGDVVVLGKRAGSVIVDFAVTPSASQADTVACILGHPDFMSAVLKRMVDADSTYSTAAVPSGDVTVRPCTTCAVIDCPEELPTQPSKSSASGSSGAVIGGVVAAVLIAALCVVVFLVVRRRGRGAGVKATVSYKASAGREGTVSFEVGVWCR